MCFLEIPEQALSENLLKLYLKMQQTSQSEKSAGTHYPR